MKKLKINRLDWDSDFFGIEVGQLQMDKNSEPDLSNAIEYEFIEVKQYQNDSIKIIGFENNFQETKLIFSKKITNTNTTFPDFIFDNDNKQVPNTLLYPLAYESGKYSRYKLDIHFKENQFKNLYQKWIDNSVNKQFADKVFYILESDIIQGFVTIKKNDEFATIGLIAVLESSQGKGFGSLLLKKAEDYCISESIYELRIPTQKENLQACNFYYKQRYTIFEESIIKHYWKK